ncbi:MAG: SPOR domain-containing protein [Caulobacterales bacterium]|nr:SPOR domain-containing protein [Caulobacterales bacterium]
MKEPLFAQPISRRQANSFGLSSSLRARAVALLAAAMLSGCSTLGGGKADVAAEGGELDWASLRVAELETELVQLKQRNADLEKQLADEKLAKAEEAETEMASAAPADAPRPAAPVNPKAVIAAADVDAALADAPKKPVDSSPRLVQPTFASGEETVFENEAETAIPTSSVLFGVHLASYRHEEAARAGWRQLQRENPDELGLLEPRIEAVTIEGRGDFLRLIGGGFSSREKAEALCATLEAKGVYCVVTDFGGERLSLTDGGR